MFLKSKYKTPGKDYTIPQIDLSQKPDKLPAELDYLFENTVVDDSKAYLGHPDSVLLRDGRILTFYPEGHGKGKTLSALRQYDDKSPRHEPRAFLSVFTWILRY